MYLAPPARTRSSPAMDHPLGLLVETMHNNAWFSTDVYGLKYL
jgi:hypothetical protein